MNSGSSILWSFLEIVQEKIYHIIFFMSFSKQQDITLCINDLCMEKGVVYHPIILKTDEHVP